MHLSNDSIINSSPIGHSAFSSEDFTFEIIGLENQLHFQLNVIPVIDLFCIVTYLQYVSEKLEIYIEYVHCRKTYSSICVYCNSTLVF